MVRYPLAPSLPFGDRSLGGNVVSLLDGPLTISWWGKIHSSMQSGVNDREKPRVWEKAQGVAVITMSTRWNSLRSEYPVVAIALRSAPTMLTVPSARWEGPVMISANVPT